MSSGLFVALSIIGLVIALAVIPRLYAPHSRSTKDDDDDEGPPIVDLW